MKVSSKCVGVLLDQTNKVFARSITDAPKVINHEFKVRQAIIVTAWAQAESR